MKTKKLKVHLTAVCRKLTVVLLAVMVALVTLIPNGGTAWANEANNRTRTAIALGAGKQVGNLDYTKLSERDLRFLGVYMSNFYVPFVTEIGPQAVSSKTDTDKESVTGDFKKIMTNNLHMSEEVADVVAPAILNQVRQGKKLKLGVGKDIHGHGNISSLSMEATWLNLMALVMGYGKMEPWAMPGTYAFNDAGFPNPGKYDEILKSVHDKDNKTTADSKLMEENRYGYLYFEEGSKKHTVFSFDLDAATVTPSVQSLMMVLHGKNLANGYGDYVFDAENGVEADNSETLEDWMKNNPYESSIANSPLFVTPFGDLTVAGGNHKYIALPGAANPYTWKEAGEKGMPGVGLPLQNVWGIGYINEDRSGELYSGGTDSASLGRGRLNSLVAERSAAGGSDKYAPVMHNTTEYGFSSDGFWSGYDSKLYSVASAAAVEYSDKSTFRGRSRFSFSPDGAMASGGGAYTPVFKWALGMLPRGTHSLSGDLTVEAAAPETDKSVKFDSVFSKAGPKVKVWNKIAYADDIGQTGWGNTEGDVEYKTLHILEYKKGDISSKVKGPEDMSSYLTSLTSTGGSSLTEVPASNDSVSTYLYFTYVFASYPSENSTYITELGYQLSEDTLPTMSDKMLNLEESQGSDIMLERIRDWVYYLLHPSEGTTYVATLLGNKIGGFLVSVSDSILGTQGSGLLSGSTKYLGIGGYVSTPEFGDVQFFDSVVNLYNDNVMYIILVFTVIILAYGISGMINWGKALIALLIFGVTAGLPAVAVSEAVTTSNHVTSWIYGGKFQFWGLTQHQSYVSKIDEAIEKGSDGGAQGYENYLRTLMRNRGDAKNLGGENISLRWQAPKKMASLQWSQEDTKQLTPEGLRMLNGGGGLVSKTFSGESFLDNPESLYMYRSYIDLGNFSRFTYAGIAGISTGDFPRYKGNLPSKVTSNWDDRVRNLWEKRNEVAANDLEMGYTNPNKAGSAKVDDTIAGYIPVSSTIINDRLADKGKIKDLTSTQYVGTPNQMWNFSLPMFGNGLKGDFIGKMTDLSSGNKFDFSEGGKYNNQDYTGMAGYGLMSESPYFYFSWNLYDQGLSPQPGATDGYKNLLLGAGAVIDGENSTGGGNEVGKGSGFFYNQSNDGQANGELKDYQNMRNLFTYVIPQLNAGNEVVREWDKVYGFRLYPGVPFEEGQEEVVHSLDKNGDLMQKYWHNVNVNRLYGLYSPWVDMMYSAEYAQPTQVEVAGEWVTVQDPLNPASYPADRPMIFSRSEMVDYGLDESQLTEVERRIQQVEDANVDSMINMLNYYTFNDSVLNSAVAIESTFNFNRVFSESHIFGEDVTLYPQNYEIKNFTFDAFLRLILAENMSKGTATITEDLDTSFYTKVSEETNLFGTIMLILVSILSTYVIPLLKTLFPFTLFITAAVMIWAAVVQIIQTNVIKNFFKSILKPLLLFMVINLTHAWVISLLMGNGNTGVVENTEWVLRFDNPIWALMLLLIINVVVTYFIGKQLKGVWDDLIKYGTSVISGAGVALSGVLSQAAHSMSGGRVGSAGGAGGAGGMGGGNTSISPNLSEHGSLKERKESMKSRSGAVARSTGKVALTVAGGTYGRGRRMAGKVKDKSKNATRRAYRDSGFAQRREGYRQAKYDTRLSEGRAKYYQKQREKKAKKDDTRTTVEPERKFTDHSGSNWKHSN